MLEKPEAFTLELPLDGRLLTIQLTRHEVLAPGFSVQSSDDGHVDYRPGLYYRGQVSGQSSSLAAVSFFDDMAMGVFSFGGTNYVLGHTRQGEWPASKTYILYDEQKLKMAQKFECHTDASEYSVPLEYA